MLSGLDQPGQSGGTDAGRQRLRAGEPGRTELGVDGASGGINNRTYTRFFSDPEVFNVERRAHFGLIAASCEASTCNVLNLPLLTA